MIRRDAKTSGGESTWVLISQIEHARVSGELARHWGVDQISQLQPYDVVLSAIYRHDDGWAEWEQAPGIDKKTGIPLSFTEIPMSLADQIWSQSVELGSSLGPLAQYLIASHFIHLRQRGDSAAGNEVSQFVRTYEPLSRGWLAEWLCQDSGEHTLQAAQRALRHVQIFDSLSLWLCCAERTEAFQVTVPAGQHITLTPVDSSQICVTPWPLSTSSLVIEVVGRRVLMRRYADSGDLAGCRSEQVTLHWELIPG